LIPAEDEVVLPPSRCTRINDLRADVSALTGRVRELETSEELAHELLSLMSQALLMTDPNLTVAQQYLLSMEGRQCAEVPVEGGLRVEKRKKKRVVVLMEMKRPRDHLTPVSQCLVSVLTPGPEEDAEDAEGEMDMDRPEENHPDEDYLEPDRPEPSHMNEIQEWLARLEPAVIAQSVTGNDEEDAHPDKNNACLEDTGDIVSNGLWVG
jgi:hypothetical protein